MNPPSFPLRYFFLTVLAAGTVAAPAWAAAPRDELLRVVPEDVGVCLLIQDLRGHTAALQASPFAKKIEASVVGQMIRTSPEGQKLAEVEKVLKETFKTDWGELRDEILGDAIVMAYRPGPPGSKPEQEQVLFLVRARDARLLDKLVTTLNNVQRNAGDLEALEERTHNNVKYFYRQERKKPAFFYRLNGPILMGSPQEDVLKRAIDLDRLAPSADKVDPPLTKKLRELNAEGGLIALWINPRVFEAELAHKAKEAQGPAAIFNSKALEYWKALDGIALFVKPKTDLEFGLAVKARTADLPQAAQRFLATAAQPSELWGTFPEDALLAFAGRVDFPALLDVVTEFLPPEPGQGLRTLVNLSMPGVYPNLGPDVGFCISAPPEKEKAWAPHMVWALRVQPGPDAVPADRKLFDRLNVFVNQWVDDYNKKNTDRMEFKTIFQDKVEVRSFVNEKRFPPGIQPAYALKSGYLVVASSPDVVQRFAPAPFKGQEGETPIMRASLRTLATYLKQRREPIIAYFAEKDSLPKEEVGRRIDTLVGGLQFFHSVELTQRVTPGQTVLTFRIRTAEPLR
jgi:hypothetical protein